MIAAVLIAAAVLCHDCGHNVPAIGCGDYSHVECCDDGTVKCVPPLQGQSVPDCQCLSGINGVNPQWVGSTCPDTTPAPCSRAKLVEAMREAVEFQDRFAEPCRDDGSWFDGTSMCRMPSAQDLPVGLAPNDVACSSRGIVVCYHGKWTRLGEIPIRENDDAIARLRELVERCGP